MRAAGVSCAFFAAVGDGPVIRREAAGGLTTAGADVIAEMNRLGMVVDAAHAAPATLQAILAASRRPVVVSHSGLAALRPYARHLPDDLLRAVAARGGLIGVWPLVRERPAGLDQFLADLHHVRRVAGIDHTALATDMTGLSTFTAVLTYEEFAAVPAALFASGFSEAECRQLLGGNALPGRVGARPRLGSSMALPGAQRASRMGTLS